MHARPTAFAIMLLLLVPALVVLPAAEAQTSTKLLVLGETHGTRTVTKDLVHIAQSKGATGCVCPGDFIYGHWETTPQAWRDMMQPFMGRMMPAQGNHDYPWSDWSSLFPDKQPYYSTTVNGVQFIALNPEHSKLSAGSTQRQWLERTLDERPATDLKVVFLHRPWWLPEGAVHPTREFEERAGTSAATMDALMREHGVDLVVSAHERGYQHSARDGIHYLVQGGGSDRYYPQSYSLPGAIKRLTINVVTTMDVTADKLTLKSYDRHAAKVEEWSISKPATSGSFSATFTPHGGNEWWVQTKVGATAPLAKVEARVNGGAWQPLSLRDWGSWATGMKAPEGSRVEFKATSTTGLTATSPAYTWPAGTPTTTPLAAKFTPYGGNEWWVQTKVDANAPLSKVDARVNGGAWQALTLRSWGAWATSMKAPQGSTVEFRATSTTGATATSGAYTWPDAKPALTATFQPHGGNEWWVQTKIATNAALSKVEARVDGGSWQPLSLRDWGSWATGMKAPEGSRVEFKATSTTGATATSGAYTWPIR